MENASPESSSAGEREHVALVGSGTIARSLAVWTAHSRGGHVLMLAPSEESAERARAAVASLCEKLKHPQAFDRVRITTDIADISESTLAVEASREELAVKRQALRQVGETLAPTGLIASTTSSLPIEELAQASGRPGRFFGLHVFNPVTRMELVEVCFPPKAVEETRRRAFAFCEAIGRTAIEVADEPGFVVNRLLFPYLFDAVRLLERTGMKPEDVDACMKLGAAYKMGPLELLDFVGLDIAEAIGAAIHADTGDPDHAAPGRIKQMIGEGKLGRKTGAGFYDYR